MLSGYWRRIFVELGGRRSFLPCPPIMADHPKSKRPDRIMTKFGELDPKEELRQLVTAIANFKAVSDAA